MNIAVIFAGGVGRRMKSKGIPKQFLEINGVPIIIQTLNIFEKTKEIDAITIACLEQYIEYLQELLDKYKITKVRRIVSGGKTGQESIINALKAAEEISKSEEDIVLIHDGVRLLINEELISSNIKNVKKYGSSISATPVKETIFLSEDHENINNVTERKNTYIAKAPQSFYLKDIMEAERIAIKNEDLDCIDSLSVMKKYGKIKELHITECGHDNLKITTPEDYHIIKAIIDYKENIKVMGINNDE